MRKPSIAGWVRAVLEARSEVVYEGFYELPAEILQNDLRGGLLAQPRARERDQEVRCLAWFLPSPPTRPPPQSLPFCRVHSVCPVHPTGMTKEKWTRVGVKVFHKVARDRVFMISRGG
jgi:hypothetical protein